VAIDSEAIAKEIGNSKTSNMVMLGAATPFIDIALESIENGIREIFGRKGEALVNLNLQALHAGRAFAEANK
jgi:indolepyruvate ferredoxin oxidoreductase beta subunit